MIFNRKKSVKKAQGDLLALSQDKPFRHRPGDKIYTHVKKSLDTYHQLPASSTSQHIVKNLNISEMIDTFKSQKTQNHLLASQ